MSRIIDHTDFTGLYIVDVSTPEKQTLLDLYCDDSQEIYLKKLMGETLYSEYQTNPSKFATLIAGQTTPIIYNGETFIYTGLSKMLVLFTYFKYIQEPEYQSNIGSVIGNSENGVSAININKLVRVHNEAVRLYYEAVRYMAYVNTSDPLYFDYETETIKEINTYGI
jgi:hypothetical protein